MYRGVNAAYGNFEHRNNPNLAKGNRMHLKDNLELGHKNSPDYFKTSYEINMKGGSPSRDN